MVPGRGAARAPVPRVRRGGLRRAAVPRGRRVRAGRRAAPGPQPAGLHQGGGGLRLARERVALLRARPAVPPAVAAALQQGGQAADQEHRVPCREGLAVLPGGRAGRARARARLRVRARARHQVARDRPSHLISTSNVTLAKFRI